MFLTIFLFLLITDAKTLVQCQEFTVKPRNTTTFELHPTFFICEVSLVKGSWQWKLPNGQLIDKDYSSSKLFVTESIQKDKLNTRLDITYALTLDSGRYECVWMETSNGNITSAAYLSILLPPESGVTHLCVASSTVSYENELVTVTCAKRIEGNDHRNENENTLRWDISESFDEMSHAFVRVDNWSTKLWYSIGFSFNAKPSHNNMDINCKAVFADNQSHDCTIGPIKVLYTPVVSLTISPKTIRDGDEVQMTCNGHANPDVSRYEWFVNGNTVNKTLEEDFIIKENYMFIPNVDKTKHDSLIIGCSAINSLGIGQDSDRIYVDNSLEYLGPMVSGILIFIIITVGLILFITTKNKKSLRVFLRTCARASFKWQNEYMVGSESNENDFNVTNFRRHSRRKPSIVLQKYKRPSDRESDEARSTPETSGRDTSMSVSSRTSYDLHLSATEASTSGRNVSVITPSTRSGLLSRSSSISASSMSFEENVSFVYDEIVNKKTNIYIIEKSKLEDEQLDDTSYSSFSKTTTIKNTESTQYIDNNELVSDIEEERVHSVEKWSVKGITVKDFAERRPETPEIEWPVTIDRYKKSLNRSVATNRNHGVTRTTPAVRDSSKRSSRNNAGFVPLPSKASNSGKIQHRGRYLKKHQKAIGSLHNQFTTNNKVKQKQTVNADVVNTENTQL